jgi:excinuclease UvrABC ATPase subunit
MNEYEYYNVDDKKRDTIRSDKPWSDLPHSKANIILIGTKKVDEELPRTKEIESFNPNIPPPEKEIEEKFKEKFDDKEETYIVEPQMRFLKVCKLCGQTVDGNLKEHIETHQPISALFFFTVVPELAWD